MSCPFLIQTVLPGQGLPQFSLGQAVFDCIRLWSYFHQLLIQDEATGCQNSESKAGCQNSESKGETTAQEVNEGAIRIIPKTVVSS